LAYQVPDRQPEADDGFDHDGDLDDLSGGNGADGLDDQSLLDGDGRGDGEGEWVSRDFDPGPGLTEPERELADELNRTRELERARDRVERLARGSAMGGGGGESPEDRDALAVLVAAERFGLETSDRDREEENSIKEALALHASQGPKNLSEYSFYAHVTSQQTAGRAIRLSLLVPWEHRDEVFRALETMPFAAQVTLRELMRID
jgi:hypothetical protein